MLRLLLLLLPILLLQLRLLLLLLLQSILLLESILLLLLGRPHRLSFVRPLPLPLTCASHLLLAESLLLKGAARTANLSRT